MRFGANAFAGAAAVVTGAVAAMAAAGEIPEAVSPGGAARLARIGDACPTFSWTAAAGAEQYELVIYVVGESETESTEVLRRGLPGGATSWTPSLDECLERGGRYAWAVRAVEAGAVSDWSPLSLFEVAARPSGAELEEALAVVRAYLATPEPGDPSATEASPATPGARGSAREAPKPATESQGASSAAGGVAISDLGITIGGVPVESAEKIVFVTSVGFQGNFGATGIQNGADDACQARAAVAGLSGVFKAWISNPFTNLSSRSFTRSKYPYVRVDGVRIADNWTDLTDGALDAAILVDEFGASVVGLVDVWTATAADATAVGPNCSGWSSNGAAENGRVGFAEQTSVQWTNAKDSTCSTQNRLYCFEQ